MSIITADRLRTTAEVAEQLRVSRWWVTEQVRRGRVQALRVGDAANAPLRFTNRHVEQLLALMTPAQPDAAPRRRRRRRPA